MTNDNTARQEMELFIHDVVENVSFEKGDKVMTKTVDSFWQWHIEQVRLAKIELINKAMTISKDDMSLFLTDEFNKLNK